MPKFKVTTDAGEGPEPEQPDAPDDLLEFPDLKSATEDAQIALAEIARDNLPDGKAAHFGVEVANEEGSGSTAPRWISTRTPRKSSIRKKASGRDGTSPASSVRVPANSAEWWEPRPIKEKPPQLSSDIDD